jgi:hypothetical protein
MPVPDDLDVAFKPDNVLAQAFQDLTVNKTITQAQYQKILSQQTSKIMQENNLRAVGIGGQGSFSPNLNAYSAGDELNASHYQRQEELKKELAGKSVLNPTADKGIYSASTFDTSGNLVDSSTGKTNDPAAKGRLAGYDPNATGTQKIFYDAQGKKINPSQLSSTKTGQDFAAAGYDIGFGPGMIGPGIKADTTERDARISASERSQRVESPTQKEVSSTPVTPSSFSTITPVATTLPPPPVKTAPIDTILFDNDSVPIEIMTDLIFENIGGQELINIARNDTVNGQTVIYQPIKNLTAIQQQYNPNNIVSLQATSDKYFQNFSVKFDNKVPTIGTGPGGAHVYIDPETGELVVEAVNMAEDEQIEVEITISGTIYEADI